MPRVEDPSSIEGEDISMEGATPKATDEETTSLFKELVPGAVIDGKYRVDEIIGRGAMGVVLGATHVHLRERVALKFLRMKTNDGSDDFHSRFRREAQVSAKLKNEHITRVIDVGVWREKVPFMVMDHLAGSDFRQLLKANGPLPIGVALDYIVQVCEGMAEAHSFGIIHRDLKPSNLFVTKRMDGSDLVKILDFGISKWSGQDHEIDELTQTGVVLGSPKYMSPEQLFGSSSVDARADVWSIGAIFYELTAGHPPFDFPTLTRMCAELASDRPPPPLSKFVPTMPPALDAAIMRCFERDRDKRVQNVAELAGSLLDAIEAPFAAAVRAKIQSILDPRSSRDAMMSTTGGTSLPLSSGAYSSLSISGSMASTTSASSGSLRASESRRLAEVQPVDATLDSRITPPSKKKGSALWVAFGLALVAIAALLVMRRGEAPPPAAVVAPPPPPPATQTAPAATVEPTPPAPVASAAPVAPVVTASAAPPAPVVTPPPPRRAGGGGRRAPAPPPPAATATVAPPAPAPTPTPAPAPTPKSNPLDDRQ